MRDNSGIIVAIAVLIGLSGLCCIGGAGAYFFMMRPRAAPPPAPYAYPAPTPPPTIYPPSGPALPSPTPLPPPAAATMLFETSDTPVRGPVGAPITIHVVSDFQCPFCSRVEPTLAQLDAMYPSQIRWVWHDYPLPFHQDAMPAAEAAREVRAQLGDAAFWSYHDQLFLSQSSGLDGRSLEAIAARVPGIDVTRFRAALVAHTHEAEVRASIAIVDATHGSTGTPTFLIGSEWLSGAQPLDSFRQAVERNIRR